METPLISPFEPGGTLPDAAKDSKATSDGVMGKDEFLKLLVTQLSNQDPLNPMDGQQFAAQLAQFSSVEQLMNISDVLAQNGEMNGMLAQSINSGVAAGLIGKSIHTTGNKISLGAEGPADFTFKLAKEAENVTVKIKNETGAVVRELELSKRASGEHTVEWDGMNKEGGRVPSGAYTYEVTAMDADENVVQSTPIFKGMVDRVTFGQDGIFLWIGKVRVAMADVESVQ